jgi:hypothetical protein
MQLKFGICEKSFFNLCPLIIGLDTEVKNTFFFIQNPRQQDLNSFQMVTIDPLPFKHKCCPFW